MASHSQEIAAPLRALIHKAFRNSAASAFSVTLVQASLPQAMLFEKVTGKLILTQRGLAATIARRGTLVATGRHFFAFGDDNAKLYGIQPKRAA